MNTDISSAEFTSTTSNASLIGLTAFGGAIVGLILQSIVASHFGAGNNTDAFLMAQSTSELLSKLLLGGSITSVFLPMFVERLTTNRTDDAWQLALNLFHLTGALFIAMIVLLAFFAEPFVSFIAPGFNSATTALTVNLLRILLPSFLLLFWVELATSMLHSLKHFAIPATLRIIAPVISIATIIALSESIGIQSYAIGVVIGSLIQILLVLYILYTKGLRYSFIFQPKHPAITHLLRLLYPFVVSALTTLAAGVVYRMLVSDMPAGSLTYLKNAEKITQLLAIIFLNSITLVIFPLLSEKAAKQDITGIKATISSAMRLIFFITLPLIAGVILLRDPLISFIFERSAFTRFDALQTSQALLFLVLGLSANGISSVLGYTVLALQRTKIAVLVTISSQIISIVLFYTLAPTMQHVGLALASSLGPLAIAIMYFMYLKNHIPNLSEIFIHPMYSKVILLTGLLTIIVFITLPPVQSFPLTRQQSLIAQLAIPTTLAATVYFTLAYYWRIPEAEQVIAIFSSKIRKYRKV